MLSVDTNSLRHLSRRSNKNCDLQFANCVKTKVCKVLIRDMLFADDAAVATHTQEELQSLMDCFSQACKDFGLAISLKKTNVLRQDTEAPLVITIDDYELNAVCQFTYLGSTITENLSLDAEINKRIGKAA